MGETAATWQRVSTGGQDEASQLPDLVKWCESHDYTVAERYVIRAKSAYHGKHAAALDQAFADMAAGKFTVLVVWKQDRIERRGMEAALNLISRAKQAGGRIEFATQPHLNKLNDMGGRISYAIMAEVASEESRTKSDRITAKHASLAGSGSLVGRSPWGMAIVKRDGRKILEPTTGGQRWIPQIFAWVIAGKSLRTIAAMLDAAGATATRGGRWHEGFLARVISNPVYYGHRAGKVAYVSEPVSDALVSPTTWQAANAALASRIRPGRGTVKHEKPLASPLCGACYGQVREGCASGKSPMYVVRVKYADGLRAMFRCSGHGPQRKGCGAPLLSVAQVEVDVTEAMAGNGQMHSERVFIPGDDRSDEIARLNEAGAAAIRASDYRTAMAAMEEAARLDALPGVAPHWEDKTTDQSEAAYFAGLSRDKQREYLSTWQITATREGVVIVPRWAVAA